MRESEPQGTLKSLWVEESGGSESLSVMGRIGVEPGGFDVRGAGRRHHSTRKRADFQTWSLITREFGKPLRGGKQMPVLSPLSLGQRTRGLSNQALPFDWLYDIIAVLSASSSRACPEPFVPGPKDQGRSRRACSEPLDLAQGKLRRRARPSPGLTLSACWRTFFQRRREYGAGGNERQHPRRQL